MVRVTDLDPDNDHHVRGFQPLDRLAKLVDQNPTSLNWSKDECITDAVLYTLATKARKESLASLKVIDLSGCSYITDTGIRYLADVVARCPKLESLNLSLLPRITHHSVRILEDVCPCHVTMNSSGLEYRLETKLKLSSESCACLNTQTAEPKLGARVLIIREHGLQSSLGRLFSPDKGPTMALNMYPDAGVTEIDDSHTWLGKFVARPWPQVVLAFGSDLAADKAQQFLTATVQLVLANSPPVHKSVVPPKIIVACVGPGTEAAKSLDAVKSACNKSEFGISTAEEFVKHWESQLSACHQTAQVQFGLALKLRESLKIISQKMDENVQFISMKADDGTELKKLVTSHHAADVMTSSHLYTRSDVTGPLTEAIRAAAKQCVVKTSDLVAGLPGKGSLHDAELKRLQDLCECIVLDVGDSPLVVTNPRWFLQVLHEAATAQEKVDRNMASCASGHVGLTDVKFYQRLRLEDTINNFEIQQYLLNLLDLLGPLVKVSCDRLTENQPGFYLLNTTGMPPPVPLDHYYSEDRSKQPHLTSRRIRIQLSHAALPCVMTSLQALVGNFCQFESLWSDGYVSRGGAAEIILFLRDNRTEIVLEGLLMAPPAPASGQDRSYAQRHLASVMNIHLDVLEYVLRSSGVLHRIHMPDNATNYSICASHVWDQPDQSASEIQKKMTVCTLCGNCTNRGRYCPHNGVRSNLMQIPFRECGCQTAVTGCWDCGICRRCVRLMWTIKSSVRPCQGSWQDFTFRQGNMFLLPTVMSVGFDEVTVTTDMPSGPYLSLHNVENRQNIQIYPGLPKRPQSGAYEAVGASFTGPQVWALGDQVRVRLKYHQPSDLVTKENEVNQYFNTHILRRMSLWQKEGLLCYTGSVRGAPVGLCASKLPMTKDHNKFAIKITDLGAESMITIGLVPKFYSDDSQPGWREKSVGYHGDDGGFFLSSGRHRVSWKAWKIGDVIECGVDFNDDDTKSVYFKYNDEKKYAITGTDRLPEEFYAAVGMHSPAEQCQLLDSTVWRADDDQIMDRSSFVDSDSVEIDGMSISPARCLTMANTSSGWKDKKAACIFIQNNSKTKKVAAVSVVTTHGEKLFDIGMRKKRKTGKDSHFLEPGDTAVALLVRAAGSSLDKEVSDSTFLIRWLDAGSPDDVTTFVSDVSKLDQKKTHRLRFEFSGGASKTNQGIVPVTDGRPSMDSHKLEIFKNGQLVTNYWLPKNVYHLQMVYPEFASEKSSKLSSDPQSFRDMPILVHMPKMPTFDLPEDFLPGMILEFRNRKNTSDPNGVFEAGVIKQVKDNGILVIQPKYQPDPDKVYETIDFHKSSTDIRPIAREFQNIRFLMGLEPPDLWNVAYGTLFTEAQVEAETKKNLWMYSSRRGTKCIACPWLTTVLEANVASQTTEAFLPRVMTSLDPLTLSVPLPRDMECKQVEYPATARVVDTARMNLHPLCYPVRLSQIRSDEHLAPAGVLSPLVPHLLDGRGYPLTPAKNDLDFMWRQSLATAWCYLTMGVNEMFLEPKVLVTGCAKDFYLVCRGLRRVLYQYACLSCLLTPGLTLSDRPAKRPPIHDAWNALTDAYTHAHDAIGRPEKLVKINLETLQERICAAHMYASDMHPSWLYRQELIQPYEKLLTIVTMNVEKRKTLESNMFENLANVEMLKIVKGNDLESIPDSLEACRKLRKLVIEDTSLTTVPKELNFSQLSSLSLVSCRLGKVPDSVCQMVHLKTLDLSYNEISSLPSCFSNLANLTVLILNGVPWFGEEHGSGSMIGRDWYTTAEHKLRQNRKILGENQMDRLWARCDLDNNNMLDSSESPELNAQLFYLVSRFGLDYQDGDEDGGFPVEVCSLHKLERLYLSNHAIRFVPRQIENLTNLKSLSLDNNPLLEALPGGFYNLKNLNKIRLHQCASLKTPPIEVVSRGMDAIFAYLKYLSADFTECRRTKLMLVGLGGAGKTSLLRALTSGKHKTKATVGEDITNGIDIGTWTVKGEDGTQVSFSTWDFAGQTVYYNTHQFFLSKRAVYLLLWTTRLGFEHAGLEFWLSSISCHAPNTPIFIVGTHCDQVHKADVPVKELVSRYPQIAGFHFVSSISGQGIADLEKRLTEVALQQPYMGEQIPGVWLELEQKIIQSRSQSRVMKYEDVDKLALAVGIFVENDTKQAVSFLHDLGTIQYFDSEFLRDHVVIDPQWIVDVMSSVVSVKDSPIKDGIFRHADIDKIWKGAEQAPLHTWLLRLTEKFDLTFPVPDMAANIVPCLLPHNEPEISWPEVTDENVRENKVIYRFTYLPAGLFNRAQVRLFEFSSSEGIWKHGSLLKKNGHLALVRQKGDHELIVKVQGPQPQNVCFLVHEVIENLINESFNGVQYELYLPCPDCAVQEATREPDLFPSSLILYAINRRAPYLQCRKYFHTISMSELQAIVPPDSSSDFDAQMNRSVHLLRSLRQELSTDIFLSFCEKDVPASKGIRPDKIRADLEEAGFRVWFPEERKSAQELAICLNDSKLMLVFMSYEYESDKTLADLFLYCRNTLKKPYVIINYCSDSGWLKADTVGSSLGMIIGAQELYIRMTDPDKYKQKFSDLKKAIQLKLADVEGTDEQPVCFISYCWANSLQACEKDGYHRKESALGPIDPRELKPLLVKNNISCWLDVEQVGQKGLFEDICEGIKGADFMVACISDEYTKSENCMMELRFAAYTLKKPIIFCVVGNSPELEPGEISMMRVRNYKKNHTVFMHERSQAAFDRLLQLAKSLKLDPSQRKRDRPKSNKPTNKIRNIAFKEEYELLQRKFLRQIAVYKNEIPIPYPKLVVLDFADEIQPQQRDKNTRRQLVRRATSTLNEESVVTPPDGARKSDKDTEAEESGSGDWRTVDMCFRVLCESDQGWHCCGSEITFNTTRLLRMTLLTSAAPYLYRMYTVLRQSGVTLNCLGGDKGAKYMDFIREAIGTTSADNEFSKSYIATLESTMKHDPGRTMGDLDRCYLPSGKIRWLCKDHQKGIRVTVLSRDIAVSSNTQKMITDYDILVREKIIQNWAPHARAPADVKRKNIARPKTGTSRLLSQLEEKPSAAQLQYRPTKAPRQDQPVSQACVLQ